MLNKYSQLEVILRVARGRLLIFLSWLVEISLLPKWEGTLPGFADLIRWDLSIPWGNIFLLDMMQLVRGLLYCTACDQPSFTFNMSLHMIEVSQCKYAAGYPFTVTRDTYTHLLSFELSKVFEWLWTRSYVCSYAVLCIVMHNRRYTVKVKVPSRVCAIKKYLIMNGHALAS